MAEMAAVLRAATWAVVSAAMALTERPAIALEVSAASPGKTEWAFTIRNDNPALDVIEVEAPKISELRVGGKPSEDTLAWPFSASASDISWLAFLGVFQLAVPCLLVVRVSRVLSGAEISLLALLELIFGVALAWLGAGEVPGSDTLTGGALVVGALVVNEWLALRSRNQAAGRVIN